MKIYNKKHNLVGQSYHRVAMMTSNNGICKGWDLLNLTRLNNNDNSNAKGVFGLTIFVTQFSFFITHNSKMMGPIAKRLFDKR